MKAISRMAVLSSAALLALFAGHGFGRQSAPTDYQLVTEEVLADIDLAKEIDSVKERQLRLSRATIAPGGHVGLHSRRVVLNLINQGDALLAGRALDWAKIILTVAVPYCANTYGAVSYHLKMLRARDSGVSVHAGTGHGN